VFISTHATGILREKSREWWSTASCLKSGEKEDCAGRRAREEMELLKKDKREERRIVIKQTPENIQSSHKMIYYN
jgi:hypothetical protein